MSLSSVLTMAAAVLACAAFGCQTIIPLMIWRIKYKATFDSFIAHKDGPSAGRVKAESRNKLRKFVEMGITLVIVSQLLTITGGIMKQKLEENQKKFESHVSQQLDELGQRVTELEKKPPGGGPEMISLNEKVAELLGRVIQVELDVAETAPYAQKLRDLTRQVEQLSNEIAMLRAPGRGTATIP